MDFVDNYQKILKEMDVHAFKDVVSNKYQILEVLDNYLLEIKN